VYADLYGDGAHGVVLAHGGRFDKSSWVVQARELSAAGFRVLAIDFRGRGQSRAGPGAESRNDGIEWDVLAAVRYLHRTGADTVSVVGASMGGWAAAQAAVRAAPGEIDRLVLLAHAPIDEPERIHARTLFIVARGDTLANGTPRLVAIRDQFERAPEPKSLVVLDGSAHAQFLFESPRADRLMREILRFLGARPGATTPEREP
jgi:pimeloyl-ACP methyl ester carboxylesterase